MKKSTERETLFKRLLYRSIHRGCKETDFLIGEFAKIELKNIKNLELFSEFLEENDLEIYDWILGKDKIPKRYLDFITGIRAFHKIL